ncbi:MAG: DUF1189 family protein, partial [Candidatus Woesebacteria bacterium]|nr:DUF1189 family protein [Candidatus Woesebacteria bacterium]
MKKIYKSICSKPKVFARTFWNSLTKPSYYKDIADAKLSFSIKYLLSLFLLVSFIVGISISVRVLGFISQTPKFVESTKSFMVETYPKELKLTLKESKITTNVKEPYFVDLAENKKASIEPFKHFIAISTKGNPEDIKSLDSLFLVTSDNLIISEGTASGNYRVISLGSTLSKIPSGVGMDKTLFTSILDTFTPYVLKMLPRIIIAISILILIFYPLLRGTFGFIFQAIFLLPATLVLFIGVKILKKN